MTWITLVELYLRHQQELGRVPGTVVLAEYWLRVFRGQCEAQGVAEPADVRAEHVAAFRQHLLWHHSRRDHLYSASCVSKALQTVRAFLRWAVERGHLLVDPARHLVLRTPPQPLVRLLTPQEVQALLAAPNPRTPVGLRDRAILELLYGTGLRRRECHRLDLDDLDFATRTIAVRRGKGGRSRLVPMGRHLARILHRYLEKGRPRLLPVPGEPAVFLARGGRRLSYLQMGNRVCHHARQAGLPPGVAPHGLRRAFATHMLRGGADVRVVQEILGHQVISSTQIYTSLDATDLQKEYQRTHPRARRRKPLTNPPPTAPGDQR